MRLRAHYILLIIMLIILEVSLIKLVPILESYKHPLVSNLTCIQTQDSNDLYWNINQIELAASIDRAESSVKISLTNNVPNFDSYFFRTNDEWEWMRVKDTEIELRLREGENTVELKARNKLGGETTATGYKVIKGDDDLKIIPGGSTIIDGKYDFHFETYKSPKIEWLRHYTVPLVADSKNQWVKYMSLKRWVREQIPYKESRMKSHWDAQRILQAVWSDSTIGFICDAYAATYTSACISVGLNARMVHLETVEGSGHYATEVWSDDYRKWIFMDPLFDCYFTMDGEPLSALELHNLWKSKNFEGVEKRHDGKSEKVHCDTPANEYFNLFHDIQLINSNDFLSNPFSSVLDLLTLKIRYIRWVDESNPRYNKFELTYTILLFYYLPKIANNFMIPFLIPCVLLFLVVMVFKKNSLKIFRKSN